jgi:hypothetical protein
MDAFWFPLPFICYISTFLSFPLFRIKCVMMFVVTDIYPFASPEIDSTRRGKEFPDALTKVNNRKRVGPQNVIVGLGWGRGGGRGGGLSVEERSKGWFCLYVFFPELLVFPCTPDGSYLVCGISFPPLTPSPYLHPKSCEFHDAFCFFRCLELSYSNAHISIQSHKVLNRLVQNHYQFVGASLQCDIR